MFKDPLCKKQSLDNISMIGRFRNISVIKFGESHRYNGRFVILSLSWAVDLASVDSLFHLKILHIKLLKDVFLKSRGIAPVWLFALKY